MDISWNSTIFCRWVMWIPGIQQDAFKECHVCGAAYLDDELFCRRCGARRSRCLKSVIFCCKNGDLEVIDSWLVVYAVKGVEWGGFMEIYVELWGFMWKKPWLFLVGGFKHDLIIFPFHIWDVILPIDELHHFSRWLLHHQPDRWFMMTKHFLRDLVEKMEDYTRKKLASHGIVMESMWGWSMVDIPFPWYSHHLPSGKLTKKYGKSPFLMGKSTINSNFQ